MNPSRAFVRLFPGVAAVALLTFTVPHALAVDAPKGSLRSREFHPAAECKNADADQPVSPTADAN